MILLCDEMLGKAIPESLRSIGYPVTRLFRVRLDGKPDTEWLTIAGRRGWLVISKNKRMLLVEDEKNTIIREKVGIIYLTQDIQDQPRLLRLLLNKWAWISQQDGRTRPFASFIHPNGRTSEVYRRGRLLYSLQ